MNGADALVETLIAHGVTTCFANPGTSELQVVAALDRADAMRAVLCLFEGVATGAADGYGRMAGHPACTLLHLGPGYANGAANLHNARKAATPIVNIVGDHATHHRAYDTPLASDVAELAATSSVWVNTAEHADDVGALATAAVRASLAWPGGPATLIVPADAAWTPTTRRGAVESIAPAPPPAATTVATVAERLRAARRPVVLLGGRACLADSLVQAERLARAGVRVMTNTFVARQARGRGRFAPERLAYFAEAAEAQLEGVDLLVLVETQSPVAFFAYPDRASVLAPTACEVMTLASTRENGARALGLLADAMGDAAPRAASPRPPDGNAPENDVLDAAACGRAIAALLPENAIISDDAVTSGGPVFAATVHAPAHDWLSLTGGAIGQGLPVAIGAAVACPDRKVLSLNGDGAALYTVQGLWTMARESLDITVIIFANAAYRILDIEFARVGAGAPGAAAAHLLNIGAPRLDWCALAQGFGVQAVRCATPRAFHDALEHAMGSRGPRLIEAVIA